MRVFFLLLLAVVGACLPALAQQPKTILAPQIKTASGVLEGVREASGIRSFKGIPFAQPPVGALRWKEPQPLASWSGVRKAHQFGPKPMQLPVFGDMNSRSRGMSEDCLYLNVWTPAKLGQERLPVLVYFYGGGWVAGDGSEPRYDGESMARKGIVSVTVNYRLGVFGFLAHPALTQSSGHHASGNYAFLDQTAALRWVQQHIAAFGGDPGKVTIAGESAGSCSVSALMASPLSRNLFAQAIGESGSLIGLGSAPPISLAEAEQDGRTFAETLGATSQAALQAVPADQLLQATAKPSIRWTTVVDGYFLPTSPEAIFTAGEQSKVPLLVGWNSQEMGYQALLGNQKPTVAAYTQAVQQRYGTRAPEVLKRYAATTDEEVEQVATDLASDGFLGFCTWKWADLHSQTGGGKPVYRFFYSRSRPAMRPEVGGATAGLAGGVVKNTNPAASTAPPARGAVHSAEIEYALGNLATNKIYAWTPDDYKVSAVMQQYFASFIKTGTPSGPGLPNWAPINRVVPAPVMHLDVNTRLELEQHRDRYLLLDEIF
ncbi:carboxylesterase/lipase family protein [Hymenobacter volaticus]|uniref:Carboxylic ester hydrolase n=1 Tax=Hymenobacter volaticus TaxID=2932254 RepID=A0ABY4GGD9_9BACT|nr:carboxylesterase family protein [Hymenobacter volaticus]UOQ69951.1 carboxylesterase family protein [Hymenobacter volaticus]